MMKPVTALKLVVFPLCLLPLGLLAYQFIVEAEKSPWLADIHAERQETTAELPNCRTAELGRAAAARSGTKT